MRRHGIDWSYDTAFCLHVDYRIALTAYRKFNRARNLHPKIEKFQVAVKDSNFICLEYDAFKEYDTFKKF